MLHQGGATRAAAGQVYTAGKASLARASLKIVVHRGKNHVPAFHSSEFQTADSLYHNV